MLECKSVETVQDLKRFIDFPWEIYQNDPYWVPPLKIAIKDLLDSKKNPFFKHAQFLPLLVLDNGQAVGRAAGIIDEHHNRFHNERAAFFGFFESKNDPAIAKQLMVEIGKWASEKGMKVLRGPINLSTNNECGLLIEGFDDAPFVMMTYNPPYYAQLLTDCGLTKAKDLYAYYLTKDRPFSEKLFKHAERIQKRGQVLLREINMKDFDHEVDRILKIYNDAWEKNWGFVPMTEEEFRHTAKDMKMILDPHMALIAEINGEAVGFSLALPDVNQVFKKVSDGKLLPFGLLKLLWNLKGPGRKKTITRCRVITLGIKRAYQELGLGAIFYTETLRRGVQYGYPQGEASWILEDNLPMNRSLERMCGQRTKVYRIYERSI